MNALPEPMPNPKPEPEPDPQLSLAEFLSRCGLSQFFDAFEKDGVTLEILKKLSTEEGWFVAEMKGHGLGMAHRDALDDGLKSLASKRNADQVGASPGGESVAPNPKRAKTTHDQALEKREKREKREELEQNYELGKIGEWGEDANGETSFSFFNGGHS